jgi:hypothetical protein
MLVFAYAKNNYFFTCLRKLLRYSTKYGFCMRYLYIKECDHPVGVGTNSQPANHPQQITIRSEVNRGTQLLNSPITPAVNLEI